MRRGMWRAIALLGLLLVGAAPEPAPAADSVEVVEPTCDLNAQVLDRIDTQLRSLSAELLAADSRDDVAACLVLTVEYLAVTGLQEKAKTWGAKHACEI